MRRKVSDVFDASLFKSDCSSHKESSPELYIVSPYGFCDSGVPAFRHSSALTALVCVAKLLPSSSSHVGGREMRPQADKCRSPLVNPHTIYYTFGQPESVYIIVAKRDCAT